MLIIFLVRRPTIGHISILHCFFKCCHCQFVCRFISVVSTLALRGSFLASCWRVRMCDGASSSVDRWKLRLLLHHHHHFHLPLRDLPLPYESSEPTQKFLEPMEHWSFALEGWGKVRERGGFRLIVSALLAFICLSRSTLRATWELVDSTNRREREGQAEWKVRLLTYLLRI